MRFHHDICLEFDAEVYRYIKTGNGKKLDYGLCNPEFIKKIDAYELPSDDDLLMQEIDNVICDVMCMFHDHCFMGNCIASDEWREETRKQMYYAARPERLEEHIQLIENFKNELEDRPYLGVLFGYVDAELASELNTKVGWIVMAGKKDSPFESGERIISVEDVNIIEEKDFAICVEGKNVGDYVNVLVDTVDKEPYYKSVCLTDKDHIAVLKFYETKPYPWR